MFLLDDVPESAWDPCQWILRQTRKFNSPKTSFEVSCERAVLEQLLALGFRLFTRRKIPEIQGQSPRIRTPARCFCNMRKYLAKTQKQPVIWR